jgi:energy-coupling factor transporter ATP-binding protein EcfA2
MTRKIELGPIAQRQLRHFALTWRQGDHALISGGTGSGKTALARHLLDVRLRRGGAVIVMVAKLQTDDTLTTYYSRRDGWRRWTTWQRPTVTDSRILFWPKVENKDPLEAKEIMAREYARALDAIGKAGKWTVLIDEGLMTVAPRPSGLGMAPRVESLYQLLRSAKGTLITCAQRPSHMPVSLYANISHAFVGFAGERADRTRLANIGARHGSKELDRLIQQNGPHDFLWIPVGGDSRIERLNLAR